MRAFFALVLSFVVASAAPRSSQRIVGGSLTTINQYPEIASLLVAWPSWFSQQCGGTILNNRAVLSAAHCFRNDPPSDWRIRVGSTFAHSGGTVLVTSQIILHPAFNRATFDSDIAILRTATPISFTDVIRPGSIASSTYNLGDNQVVWAAGWGLDNYVGSFSEQLRHVQVWTINQAVCASRYAAIRVVTDNMLCSGWLDVGGRDQCQGDSGGPLYHNGVVVGVCSWGYQCGLARYPGVNTRVSQFTNWIVANA